MRMTTFTHRLGVHWEYGALLFHSVLIYNDVCHTSPHNELWRCLLEAVIMLTDVHPD